MIVRLFKLIAFVILSPLLAVAVVMSVFSVPFNYLITGDSDMVDFFGKACDLLDF